MLNVVSTDTMVLEDLYNNPIEVNRQNLLIEVTQRWQEQMNAWLHEFQQSSKQR
jgi:hypothetical protein